MITQTLCLDHVPAITTGWERSAKHSDDKTRETGLKTALKPRFAMNHHNMSVGATVYAIKATFDDEVLVFGEGIYVGEEIPHKKVTGNAGFDLRLSNMPDGKIILDNGLDVFFCECERVVTADEFKRIYGTRKLKAISVTEDRKERKLNKIDGRFGENADGLPRLLQTDDR